MQSNYQAFLKYLPCSTSPASSLLCFLTIFTHVKTNKMEKNRGMRVLGETVFVSGIKRELDVEVATVCLLGAVQETGNHPVP